MKRAVYSMTAGYLARVLGIPYEVESMTWDNNRRIVRIYVRGESEDLEDTLDGMEPYFKTLPGIKNGTACVDCLDDLHEE